MFSPKPDSKHLGSHLSLANECKPNGSNGRTGKRDRCNVCQARHTTLQEVKRTTVEMRIVNEAGMPCINEAIADILNLPIVEKQIVRTASGELIELDVADYVEIGLNNHWDTCRALVLKGNSMPTISSARVKNLTQPYVRI